MASTTTNASAADHLDPWGFGRCDDGGRPAVEHVQNPVAPVTLAALEAHDDPDQTAAFPPFAQRHAALRSAPQVRAGTREWLAVLAVFAVAVLGQAFYIGFRLSAETPGAPLGTLVVSSHPAGLQVLVDGQVAGTTPLAYTTSAGRHHVEITSGDGRAHTFEAELVAGEQWRQHLESGTPESSAALEGVGAAVSGATASARLDAPRVVPTADSRREAPSARPQTAGASAPRPRAAAAVAPSLALGWVRVDAPFDVDVYEKGVLLGSSGAGPVSLPAGGHVLELVNDALGYRVLTKAAVLTGKTTGVALDTPKAVVHVNAQPWAEVLVDGTLLGETPLANVMLPIGQHQLVFRHPDLGERTQTFTVRAGGPNRVAADLRR